MLSGYAIVNGINSICAFIIAVLIFAKQSRKPLQLSYALFSIFVSGWTFCYFFWCLQPTLEPSLRWHRALLFFTCFLHTGYFHFCLAFSNNIHKYKKALIGSYLLSALFSIVAINNGFFELDYIRVRLPFLFWPHASMWLNIFISIEISTVLLSFWILYHSIQHIDEPHRIRLKFFLLLNIIGWTGGLTNWFYFYDSTPIPPVGNPAVTFYLIGTFYLMIRHDILELNIAIRKTFVYATLTLFITLIYTIIILIFEKAFQSMMGYDSFVASLFAAALIAILFNPLRHFVSKLLDKIIFGKNIEQLSAENFRMQTELQKADQMKAVATLAAGMAHEIKNPLTSIKTFAEYLPQKYDDPEFREKFSRIVTDEVDRVNNIVKQLLEFSKPKDLELKPESITEILDDTLGLLNNNLLRNKIEVVKDYKDSPVISVDKNQLKQAFLNLFINSIQAMPNGGTLTVTVSSPGIPIEQSNLSSRPTLSERSESKGSGGIYAKTSSDRFLDSPAAAGSLGMTKSGHARNDMILITISDTGTGIPKDQLEHVFDPFFTTKEEGTGLGLSIVHGIITKHGGEIKAVSEKQKGTTISVSLKNRS